MRKIFLLLSIAILFCSATYQSRFKDEYDDALSFLKENNGIIHSEAVRFGTDDTLLRVIVFPELTRYSMFRDFFETSGNELLYIKGGKDLCDFSIGPCQMKPSFAEDVERVIAKSADSAKFSWLVKYTAKDDKGIRTERIARIKKLSWQCRYVCAFIAILNNKLPAQLSREEQLKFYASAYNLGIYRNAAEITNWQSVKAFPYGKKKSSFSYCDVALEYYHHLTNSMN
jgi:hypothetical protein